MTSKSIWGTCTFSKSYAPEDNEVKSQILQVLKDIGKTGLEQKENLTKLDDIHKMHLRWQTYSAEAFRSEAIAWQSILSKFASLLLYNFCFLHFCHSFPSKCINSFVIIIGEGGDEAAFDNEADVTPQMKIKQQLDSRS